MKSLIILGVPRAGKSTLAHMVASKLGANGNTVSLIYGDAVIGGLTQVRHSNLLWRTFIRPLRHIIPFANMFSRWRLNKVMMNFVVRFLTETAQNSIVVFEGVQISPDMAARIFPRDIFQICTVGYPTVDAATKCKDIKSFDNKSHISRLSDKKMSKRIKRYIKKSIKYRKQCAKHDIVFIDTSHDYQGALTRFSDNICTFLDNN